jgi:hypothetical protein
MPIFQVDRSIGSILSLDDRLRTILFSLHRFLFESFELFRSSLPVIFITF